MTGEPPPPAFDPSAQVPYGYYLVPPPPPRPRTVTAAFWLTMAGAALSVVATIVFVFVLYQDQMRDNARESLRADRVAFTEADIETGSMIASYVTVFLSLLLAAPFITFACLLLRPYRNWARVTLTVLVAVGGIAELAQFLVVDMDFLDDPFIVVSTTLLAGISVAVVFLLYSDSAKPYFAQRPTPGYWYGPPPGTAPPTHP